MLLFYLLIIWGSQVKFLSLLYIYHLELLVLSWRISKMCTTIQSNPIIPRYRMHRDSKTACPKAPTSVLRSAITSTRSVQVFGREDAKRDLFARRSLTELELRECHWPLRTSEVRHRSTSLRYSRILQFVFLHSSTSQELSVYNTLLYFLWFLRILWENLVVIQKKYELIGIHIPPHLKTLFYGYRNFLYGNQYLLLV